MYSFPKKERLCSYLKIKQLFAKGNAFLVYPFSIKYLFDVDGAEPVEVMIVCSKRYQHHACHRNLIKRRIREAYRLNNHTLKENLLNSGTHLRLAISYVSKDVLDYQVISEKLIEVLNCLQEKINQQ